jgi:uncharacterized protein (TIGR02145 family)
MSALRPQGAACLAFAALVASSVSAAAQEATFVDPRDGRRYPLVETAGTTWFASHLAYAAPGSFCFGDDPANCERLGRLYPWEVAMRACPPGWHLSTEQEWQHLEAHLGMAAEELQATRGRGDRRSGAGGIGDALKVGGRSGLDVELAGWRRPDGSYREGNGNDRAAALWTATEADAGTAWHRDVSSARSVVWRSPVDTPYALSVRCVRDR